MLGRQRPRGFITSVALCAFLAALSGACKTADPRTQEWKEHPLDIANHQKKCLDVAQILVYDVNGDGLVDLIASAAHDYGIYWYEQVRQGNDITFKQHLIDDSWSQVHSLALAGGKVVAWGDRRASQTVVPFLAGQVLAVAGGASHSLALIAVHDPPPELGRGE
mgnify:CR=1 FL=1